MCDRVRLTRAWSRELRRRRPSWGAWCRKPFSADDRGWTVNYLPAGEAVTRETRTIHRACATAWIIGRVRPEPWLESFRWFTTAQRRRPGLAWVAVADCPCAGYFLWAPLLSRRLDLGVDRESLSHRIRDLRATGSEAWVSTRHGTPEDPSVVVRDHRPDRAP